MAGPLTVAWNERLTGYDFGPGHPLAPVRVELTMALAREFGLLDRPDVAVLAPAPAQMTELAGQRDRQLDPHRGQRMPGAEVVRGQALVPDQRERAAH